MAATASGASFFGSPESWFDMMFPRYKRLVLRRNKRGL
jgi:hypothetical protein